jgi:DNA-binding NarL/FixJ family response regulator
VNGTVPISILLVDDSEVFRRAARLVVQSCPGFQLVGEAATGEDAVTLAADLQPDLVLMDINLPGIDGLEATRRIITRRPETIVIVLSTYPADQLPPAATSCGAWRYVHKEQFGPASLRDAEHEARPSCSCRFRIA